MKKIKISQLPLYNSLEGLSTIGTDADNRSVRVELSFIVQAFKDVVAEAKAAAEAAQSVADDTSAAISGKVDKVEGKGLSANDFTDAFKAKLEGLSNYDDAEVRSLIAAINGRLDTIIGDGASTAIDTFNEIEAFLTGITDTQTLTGLLAEQKQTITSETDTKLAGKVDKVTGKGLSTNDYTNADKTKLDALPTKTELDASLASKQPAITPSDDIAPLGSDKLALTDKAKMAELDAQAAAIGAIHNYTTGYFEYNTLVDITTAQMRAILYTPWNVYNNRVQCPTNIRTNIYCDRTFTKYYSPDDYVSLLSTFINTQLEVLKLCADSEYIAVNNISGAFYGSKKLRTIIGGIQLSPNSAITASQVFSPFGQCSALENIRLSYLSINISFADSPLLSLTSIQYMVDNAANTTPITITLHPDAHARLTEELIAQAAEKQITFATT